MFFTCMLRADLFMSKLSFRLSNLGYLGRQVKSVAFIHGKTNQSLLIHELNLIHITTP